MGGKSMGVGRYVIRGGVEGRERLRLLAEVNGPTTRSLLAEVGVPVGSLVASLRACRMVGCGLAGLDRTTAL